MWARIRWVLLISGAACMLVFVLGRLTYELEYGSYQYVITEGPEPELSAQAWSVFDMETGEVLMRTGTDTPFPIASLTKLMTAHVVLEEADLAATATVSWRAVSTEGRAGRLAYGDQLTVRELLFPLLLESSNDAAEALGDVMGRDSMIALMNHQAEMIGMTATNFDDPTGLSKDNRSTVADMQLLTTYIWRTHRYLFDITRLPKYIGVSHTWMNGNLVAAAEDFRGGKAGYTDEAKHTLIAIFDQPLKGGGRRTVGLILLQSEDVGEDSARIRSYLSERVAYEYII